MRKRRVSRRLLAILLALSMCLSLLPMTALAEDLDLESPPVTTEGEPEDESEVPPPEENDEEIPDEEPGDALPEEGAEEDPVPPPEDNDVVPFADGDEAWDAVEWAQIQSGGTYAVTMTVGDAVYLLPTSGGGKNGQPLAVEATIADSSLMANPENCGWTFVGSSSDGYAITTSSGAYLYTIANNNGMRIGGTEAVWKLDGNYLTTNDTGGTQRWLGVYNKEDWRAYTNTTGNTKDQSVTIWHLSSETTITPPVETKVKTPTATPASGSIVSPGDTVTLSCGTAEATFQTSPDNSTWADLDGNTFPIPNDASGTYTIYVKAVKEGLDDSAVLTLKYTIPEPQTPPANGTKVVIYNAANKAVAGELNSNSKLEGVSATLANGKLTMDSAPLWLTVEWGENDTYAFRTDAGKYLTSTERNAVTLEDTPNASSWWTLEDAGAGWYIKNAGTTTLTFQYYSGSFSTFTGSSGAAYLMEFYTEADVTVNLPEPPKETYKPVDGDVVAIYYPKDGLVMKADMTGTAAPAGGGVLFTDGSQLMLTVSVDANGYYTFTSSDGKVLNTGATGGNLTLVEPGQAVCSAWTLEAVDNGWMVHSTEASYNGNKNQYIEYYNRKFTTYSYNSGDKGIYTMQFFPAASIRTIEYSVDTEVEQAIAQWGGGSRYEDSALSVQGDLITVGDMLDSTAVFTAVKNGSPVKPFTTGTSAGSSTVSNWYMGGTSIGATKNDYLQFVLSSKGWGGMKLSFRLRATNAGAGSWTLQYSSNGTDFANFTTGSYSASYTSYPQGVATPVTLSGTISDGIARTSLAAGNYVSFAFDVPVGAEDAETLYIRLVPGSDRADGGSGAVSGTIRIDTVKLTGSPIVSDTVTACVQVDPDNSDEVGSGTTIHLTSEPGAVISYGWADNATGAVSYAVGSATVVPGTLPATLFVKAQADGKAESVTRVLTYLPASVASVKMAPNGGGVYTGGGPVDVTLSTATDGATIYYTRSDWSKIKNDKGEDVDKYEVYTPGTTEIVLNPGFGELTISAYAEKAGFTTSAATTRTFTERSSQTYQLFFGQMHSHTSYSDGAGTAAEAYSSVKALDHDKWNMDFLSVTDHSNSFDDAGGTKHINDAPTGQEWKEGKALAASVTDGSFVGIFGYEMTWSNGLGHINTFNTVGFQDRTQSSYTTYSTALQNYYAELKTASASISQFNHPGTTFGDFSDFSYFDEEIDQLITLIEVGNGEGAIGSSGYFPSYEYYTRALDKGWHVAPTNNQDNHKGGWGIANTGRDVVLVDELTEEAIYDAMRNYRVYATEDLNLEIYYTFDGNIMGTILDADSYGKDDKAVISVDLHDKDDAGTARVQVIVNGGAVAAETTATCNETVTLEVPTTYAYYYIKVTQADGDIAVTAPVWVGKVEAVGISGMSASKELTVAGQEQGITLELYNNENKPLEISSIVFTDKATGKVLHTATDVTRVPKMGTARTSFTHVFTTDGSVTVTATVRGTLDGVEKTYTQDLELKVMPQEVVSKIVVDGTHYNDYVTGYYGANMGNMTSIAATLGVEVVVKTGTMTAADLEDCRLLVISAPARKSGTANAGDYTASLFEDSFIQLVKDYVAGGGSVVVCGLADYQDKGGVSVEHQASVQQNKLLEAIGSTMRINDDEAYDNVNNGGQAYRLYPEIFNTDSKWCKGVVTHDNPNEYGSYQTYSQYSGCTVDPGQGVWLVRGFDTTYSIDSDGDGVGGIPEGEGPVYFLACEEIGNGTIFAAGGVFLSDFEVKAELDNIWDLPYANRTIFENILSMVREGITITPIAQTRKAPLNKVFTIEGYVTSGTTNPNTTFFDSIYVQDETGGTDVFPYASEGLAIGTKVRVLGYTDAYQGDRELQVISLEILDAPAKVYQPTPLTTAEATNYANYGGLLVSTGGTVSDIVMAGGRVSQFRLTDSTGVPATVFIDGYITNPDGVNNIHTWLREGQTVTAVGLLYSHPEGDSDVSVPVLRVRNCDEITLFSQNDPVTPSIPDVPVNPSPAPGGGSGGTTGGDTAQPAEPPVTGPVTTGDVREEGTVVTETTAVIESTTVGSAASAGVPEDIAEEIVDQAVRNNSDTVVIAPDMGGGVTEAEVSIPADLVKDIAEKTHADLRIETPVADVTIPNEGLSGLAAAGGEVTVSANRSGSTVEIAITANGRQVDKVTGGVTVRIPQTNCTAGTVAMLVHEDGTTEVVRQSVASSDGRSITVPLDGSAKIIIVDNSVNFRDVPATNWAADAVAFASSHELMNGTGDGIFDPNASMTRGMLATVLHNLENNPDAGTAAGFGDVDSGIWYAKAVVWAAANGIVTGYADGSFGPNDPISREQLAVMLYRYAGSPAANASLRSFADADEVSGYAQQAIAWATANGIMNGKSGGVLDPKGTATRAEVAQMLLNFVSSMA